MKRINRRNPFRCRLAPRRRLLSREAEVRCTLAVDVTIFEMLEDRTLLSTHNPFQILEDDGAFDDEAGSAVRRMIEFAAGGLDSFIDYDDIVRIVTKNSEPLDGPHEIASVSFNFGAGASVTAGAKLGLFGVDVGVSSELVSFKGGIGIERNLLRNEWTISRGIKLELISSKSVGAEEYLRG